MNNIIKNLFAIAQNSTVVLLCIACTLILGCKSSFEDNGIDNKLPPQVKNSVENPYYFYGYEGKKVYLTLNTEYAYLSVKEPQLSADIMQRGIKATDF